MKSKNILGVLMLILLCAALVIVFFLNQWYHVNRRVAPLLGLGNVQISKTVYGQRIEARGAGYAATIPPTWYIEPRGAGGVAVYPDFAPDTSVPTSTMNDGATTSALSSPTCKIELSVFDNASSTDLNDWIPIHLREDPTVAVIQTSLEARMVSSHTAIIWTGTMDGMKTILVFVNGNLKIYEIAPSSLASDSDVDACVGYLDEFLKKLEIYG